MLSPMLEAADFKDKRQDVPRIIPLVDVSIKRVVRPSRQPILGICDNLHRISTQHNISVLGKKEIEEGGPDSRFPRELSVICMSYASVRWEGFVVKVMFWT